MHLEITSDKQGNVCACHVNPYTLADSLFLYTNYTNLMEVMEHAVGKAATPELQERVENTINMLYEQWSQNVTAKIMSEEELRKLEDNLPVEDGLTDAITKVLGRRL